MKGVLVFFVVLNVLCCSWGFGQVQDPEFAFSIEINLLRNWDRSMGGFWGLCPEGKVYIPLSGYSWISGGYGFWGMRSQGKKRWALPGEMTCKYVTLGIEAETPVSRSVSSVFKCHFFRSKVQEEALGRLYKQMIPGFELGFGVRTMSREPFSLDFQLTFVVPMRRFTGIGLNIGNDPDNLSTDEISLNIGGMKLGVLLIFKLRHFADW